MRIQASLLLLVACAGAHCQKRYAENFVIDHTKPYAYIKFDHIGPRTPQGPEEGNIGLWLRIVNNCRIPIVVPASGYPKGDKDPGVGVLDEIELRKPGTSLTMTLSNGKEITIPPQPPKTNEQPPKGYAEDNIDVFSPVDIQPGASMLFSVPLNHVSDWWNLYVRASLKVRGTSGDSYGQPYTYLIFTKNRIPPDALAKPTPQTVTPPDSNSEHEPNHTNP